MPVLFIHGVATRTRERFFEIKPYLERLVAPAISTDPGGVLIDDLFWGDAGVTFAWDGTSRPRTRLLGQGAAVTAVPPVENALTAAAFAEVFGRLPTMPSPSTATGGLVSGGAAASPAPPKMRIKDLAPDELGDLLAVMIGAEVPDAERRARLVLAADAVAHDPMTSHALGGAQTPEQEFDLLLARVRQRAEADVELVGMGIPPWLAGVRDRLSEAVSRALDLPTYAVSVVVAEIRPHLNEFLSLFLGDAFAYLNTRGKAPNPGEIPRRLIEKLKAAHQNSRERGGEPLIVLSHSMGGQIVYDAVTHFLPGDPALHDVRINFWCATASQVGFFEEAKLFLASDRAYRAGRPVPFPHTHLGVWWNVWDENDFLSFTVKDIVDKVIDEPFDSGMSLLEAHGGYLMRPSFFRAFANKLGAAATDGWRIP